MMDLVCESTDLLAGRTVRKWVLPHNGLTVITLQDDAAPVFAYHCWFRVGSRHEQPGKTGMAHLFEHMMFKATSTLADGELDKIMERRGAQTNAATWVDWTYFHEALPATGDNLETVIRLEADRMQNLRLDTDQLEAEREVVMNERRYRVDDDPMGRLYEELYDLALEGHPYSWPTIGWMEDIEAITLEDCQAFYTAYYSPNNAIIVLVGHFDIDQALALIEAAYGPMEAQAIPVEAPAPVLHFDSVRRRELTLPISSERLLMGWVGLAINDDGLAAVDVLVEVLFGGDSSRVHRRLVLELEWASAVDGWVSHFTLPGIVEVSAVAKPDRTAEEIEVIVREELDRIAAEGPTELELQKARNQLEIAIYRSNYTANSLAGRFGHYEATAGDFRHFGRATRAVMAVSAEDVRAACTRIFGQAGYAVVVGRPGGEPEEDEDE